jgi:hypothetical protein
LRSSTRGFMLRDSKGILRDGPNTSSGLLAFQLLHHFEVDSVPFRNASGELHSRNA